MLIIYRIQYLISVSVQTRQIKSKYHSIFHWLNYIFNRGHNFGTDGSSNFFSKSQDIP